MKTNIKKIKEKIIESLEDKYKDIHREVFCDECNKLIPRQFRFTDWDNEDNDVYGDFGCCLIWFKKAVEEDKTGRYSIYAVTICNDCDGILEDEGVLFNENCCQYQLK